MRRLGLLAPVSVLVLSPACARINPAFDDCLDADCNAEGSDSVGDGDGDDNPGDGDGDGMPGDGDGDTATDTSTSTSDTDTDTGDGDGDPGLPTCPNAEWVTIPLVEDTFLDASYSQDPGCTVDWDYVQNLPIPGPNTPCNMLDFGGSTAHWVCADGGCNSMWLGRFAVDPWQDLQAEVHEAGMVFAAKIHNEVMSPAEAYELNLDGVNFGDCGTWMAGPGAGVMAGSCVTTHLYAAEPHLWGVAIQINMNSLMKISSAMLPPYQDPTYHQFEMPLDTSLVQGWLDGEAHSGVLLRTLTGEPTNAYLQAQGSGQDPALMVKLCVPG